MHRQIALLDDHPRPDVLLQFAFANHPVAMLDQTHEEVECARPQCCRLPVDKDFPLVGADLETRKRQSSQHCDLKMLADPISGTFRSPSPEWLSPTVLRSLGWREANGHT